MSGGATSMLLQRQLGYLSTSNAFDTVLLVGCDLARQWRSGIEAQMRNRHDECFLAVSPHPCDINIQESEVRT
jgi:hypothetical protein